MHGKGYEWDIKYGNVYIMDFNEVNDDKPCDNCQKWRTESSLRVVCARGCTLSFARSRCAVILCV
jgi:hypothetical protein